MHTEKERTPEEVITDKALLLALFSLSSQKGELESMLKAQKLSFLAALPLFVERKKALSIEFYRHKLGTMATGVYKAIDDFDALGLIRKSTNSRLSDPSNDAKRLVRAFWEEVVQGIPENRFIGEHLDRVIQQYGHLRASRLVDLVYDMNVPTIESSDKRPIRDIPLSEHFTMALDDNESALRFSIPDDWMDTLAIALNPKNHAEFVAAMESPTVHQHS